MESHLREEMGRHPDEDIDWKISAILAKSESSEGWEAAKGALALTSGWAAITEILRFHWPHFSKMYKTAQDEWVTGLYYATFGPAEDRKKPPIRRNAALACAKALEIEIREKIFVPFEKRVTGKPQLHTAVGACKDDVLQKFILKKSSMTFGEMVGSIITARNPTDEVLKALKILVAERAPGLTNQENDLKKINKSRIPATQPTPPILKK